MNEASIAELAASLKSTGLIQPIVLRKVGEQYQLIAGERRWRAAKLAGLVSIPAVVREATSFEQAQMALVENIQRENLNPIDRALAYKTLMTQLGLTQGELANRTGEDRSSIANFLRLLDLTPDVQTFVTDGRLSLGHPGWHHRHSRTAAPSKSGRVAKPFGSQSRTNNCRGGDAEDAGHTRRFSSFGRLREVTQPTIGHARPSAIRLKRTWKTDATLRIARPVR
jgi:ParB/RepB/Spo0J family partition protein